MSFAGTTRRFLPPCRDWDSSGLDQYLTGAELIARATDIQSMILRNGEYWFEPRSFEVTAITFPQPDRAVVETSESWYEWITVGGQTREREWLAPERYDMEWIDGRWYIA